ncbi:MAG: DKNYY domain-containing protein [Myxococcota bacterium]
MFNEKKGKIVWAHSNRPGVPESEFRKLNGNYGVGPEQVWYQDYPIDGADSGSFQALGPQHARDNGRAYFLSMPIEEAEPQTFSALGWNWSKDARTAFWRSTSISTENPSAFEALSDDYAKDDRRVYDLTSVLKGADPASFVVLAEGFAKDAQSVWENGQRRDDLDAATFDGPEAKESADERWTREAREGNPRAAMELANVHGDARDYFWAEFWTQVAADLGHSELYGYDVEEGLEDVPVWADESTAELFYQLALFHRDADRDRARVYLQRAVAAGLLTISNRGSGAVAREFPWARELLDR